MSFSQPLWFVFSSGGLAVALCAAVALLSTWPRAPRVRQLVGLVALFYLVASIYVVPAAIGRLLLGDLRPLTAGDLPPAPRTIVVLGAGSMTVRDWDGRRYVAPDPSAAARALEAARIFRMDPSATVISSGGLLSPDAPGTPTGEAMAVALRQLGVPETQLIVETESRNTHEEAMVVGRMLPAAATRSLVLVTVDVHMRRSVGAFAAAGLRVTPAIAQPPEVDLPARTRWTPSDQGLWYSGFIAHELLGIAYYWLRGWFTW